MARRPMSDGARDYFRERRASKKAEAKRQERARAVEAEVEAFNLKTPIGTDVRYWPGVREGEGRIGRTRSAAQSLSGHTAVVWVTGHPSCIALHNVEPTRDGAP